MWRESISRQKGASMIEILVTMIIVAIGLLGHASLIAVSTKTDNAAFMRSQATLLAHDMLERLRMNPALAKAGNFNIALTSDPPTGTTIQNIEIQGWRANISQALPSGKGSVSVDGTGLATIEIEWDDIVKGTAGKTKFITQSVI